MSAGAGTQGSSAGALEVRPTDVAGPIDAVAEQLRAAGVLALERGPGHGDGWMPLAAALEEVPAWHADLARSHGDVRAAAAYLAGWIAGTPALVIGFPALLAGVVPDVTGEQVALHRAPRGWVDAYAIDPTTVEVGAVAADGVLARAADRIVSLTATLVEPLCAQLPVGPVAVWGGIADVLAGYALWFARQAGADERRAWSDADRLIDHLAARAPIRPRPRPFPVAWSGGESHYLVRGTCCLYYRTCSGVAADEHYCATCPLRDDASRTDRLVAALESTA